MATPTKGFVNEALNLRGSDVPASLNPFEIHRRSEISAAASNPVGVENPALSEDPLPTNLKIGLPFVPTVGCRIDFNGISLAQLTPSKLLADKLVFSPVAPISAPSAKRSLGAISEESSMDIGKELDRYQLELENSINEAKLRKNGVVLETTKTEVDVEIVQQLSPQNEELQRRIVCTTRRQTLTEITEASEEQELEKQPEEEEKQSLEIVELAPESVAQTEPEPVPELDGGDVAYASESEPEDEDDELDFKAPARFVRAYRPAAIVSGSKESLQSIVSSQSSKSEKSVKSNGHGVRNMIRKSIRKLMHPMQQQHQQAHSEEPAQQQNNHQHHHNIISSIRHSLRRRPQKPQPAAETTAPADISIVDSSERTMKLRSNVPQTEYMRIEQLTNEKKHTLRNSIRRSTRDVLRHVFHKSQDAYATTTSK